jgi:response regulator RpfG family c-di-GMP phosphodiesterase
MHEHDVHIIMTDQRMPKITGVDFLKAVRLGHPQAIRMLFTGYADLDSVVAAINQGHIFQFLKKPWRPEELLAAVREAAMEFDRLVGEATHVKRLQSELQHLQERVAALEDEVQRLRQLGDGI